MAIEGSNYEIELLRATKEIILKFIESNPAFYAADRGIPDSERISAMAGIIATALHKAVKQQ